MPPWIDADPGGRTATATFETGGGAVIVGGGGFFGEGVGVAVAGGLGVTTGVGVAVAGGLSVATSVAVAAGAIVAGATAGEPTDSRAGSISIKMVDTPIASAIPARIATPNP